MGLLGPNGAGKSTLILTLLGFLRPSAGRARILGLDCRHNMGEARSRIGYMPENDSFVGEMTAVTFVRQMAELSGLPPKAALEKAHEVLFHVGLGESRYRELRTYSYGMKQMAKLAQAIVHGPELVVLDEPTNGLDPAARRRMLKLIVDMKEEQGMNVLVCSHLLRDIEQVCDEAVILKDGTIVHQCNLEEERRSNRHFVELEVTGDDRHLRTALPEIGAEGVSEGAGRWRIVLPPDVEVEAVWELAARQNLLVRKLTHRRDTLEEIFLKAMGHLSHTPGEGPPAPPSGLGRGPHVVAVYKRGYQRYAGPLTGRWTRFMVLPRYAWRRLYQERLVLLLTMAAFVWPLLCAGFVYLTNHVELLQGLEPEFREFIQVDGRFFAIFMYVQGACAVFLAALAGPGLLAPDLANNALPLYFSRPLTRWSYALARLTVLVGMLSIVTWIPGLAAVRTANWPGRRLVVPGELDAGCRHGGRVSSLAPRPESRGDGQFRLREMAGRGRRGQPRLLLHPRRCVRDDRRSLARVVGAHPGSGLGRQPGVGHAAGRGSARRSGCRGIHARLGDLHPPARPRDRTQAAPGRGGPMTEAVASERSEARRTRTERAGEAADRRGSRACPP